MSRVVGVIGVPTSAGAFAPGQEQAPAALRAAGLLERLAAEGLDVRDHGDRDAWRWRPDRASPRAQHVERVIEIVQETAGRVAEAAAAGEVTLVLGGDCTVGIGTVAGHVAGEQRVGLVYFDSHADLNVPESVLPGTLDWMGMAHMLGDEGAVAALAEAGPRAPMLDPDQVVLLGWNPEVAQEREREAVARLGLAAVPREDVQADPEGAAARALAHFEGAAERILVHFDVDVVDFADTPLSENPGRNEGVAYTEVARALAVLLAAPNLAALTVTELNPDHVEEGAGAIERLAGDIARGLAAG